MMLFTCNEGERAASEEDRAKSSEDALDGIRNLILLSLLSCICPGLPDSEMERLTIRHCTLHRFLG